MPHIGRIPIEHKKQIIENWENGMTATSAAIKLGYHGSTGVITIQDYIASGELSDKAHAILLKDIDKGKIGALYKAGWTYDAIAQDMAVDVWTVKYVLTQEGLIDGKE